MKIWSVLFLVLLLLVSCSQEVAEVEQNVSALNNFGVYYASQGDNENAKLYFEKVLEIDLTHETARENLALIYFKEGDYANAIEQYTRLTQLSPGNPAYHYDLAINIANNCQYNNVCDLDRAIFEFGIADKLSPGYQMAAENIEALKAVQAEMNS